MAVLSDVDIKDIIAENKGIILMNMHDKNLTALGYDFTIGFICDSDSGNEPEKIECVFDKKFHKEYSKTEFFNDSHLKEDYERSQDAERYKQIYRYKLLPGKRYLVISEEYVALFKKYMATLHSRGSYALKGIIVTSTTIDPNYCGFIYASLINCSAEPVYIKEHNQFITMVIQTLVTKTDKSLPETEGGMPKDAEQTLNGRFSNVCKKARLAAKTYRTDSWKKIEREFEDQYAAYRKKSSDETRFSGLFSKAKTLFLEKVLFKKGFWIGLGIFLLLILAYATGGMDEVKSTLHAFSP